MRTITYLINDIEGLKKENPEYALKEIEGFKAYYTLKEDNDGTTYSLEDLKGNKLNINYLNQYQKMFINECYDSFIKKREISSKYKNYITILDTPREINKSIKKNEKFMQMP